jgi:amino acid adenylation domain-containing protein
VLKAGGAYLPLDPVLPRKRLAYMVADAQPVVVITQPRLQSELPPNNAHNVVIDAEAPPVARPEQRSAGGRARDLHDLAYVIYTSGSTGEPKGVEIEDRALVNMLASMQRRPGFSAEDTILAITTIAFDIAALEIFLPLVSGGCVVIAPSEIALDSVALIDLVARSGATVLQATPATLRMLLGAGWAGDGRLKVFCGGEAWAADLASELLPRCGSLWNMYGPTETTVWSAVAKVEAGRPIAIGPPIAKTRLYVLDGSRQLVPVGVSGELYIGGDGLARGYFRRPELTRESFVADPFSERLGARMYRTGDLVRRQEDGSIEFLGRIDHQVKIRGHRIELGEIEVALARHPSVEQAVVMAREDLPGDIRLVAYIIPSAGVNISAGELRLLLGEALPAYMIPAAFVSLVAFPLTPNGKLDRKALPAPDASGRETDVAPVEPRSETERVLERIWRQALGLERIDARANFFDVGGHSLLAVRVIGELNKALNVYVNVPQFFQNPTIEGLARSLEQEHHVRPKPRVLLLQPGHARPPLYFVGAGPVEIRIAKLMGENRTIFGTDVPMPIAWRRAIANADRAAWPTMAQLGALHGEVVRAHAGTSPCVVAGYSFQGKVVIEAARALQRLGGNLALVLLIDSTAWTGTAHGIRQTVWRNLRWIRRGPDDAVHMKSLSASLRGSWRSLRWLLAQAPLRIKRRLALARSPNAYINDADGFVDEEGTQVGVADMQLFLRILLMSFNPRPLDAAAVLFRATRPGDEMLPGDNRDNGWGGRFVQGLEIIQTRGDHWSLVRDERNTAALALQINAVLDRYSDVRHEGRTLARTRLMQPEF